MSHEALTSITFTVHSSFGKLYNFAVSNSLMRLANHDTFVEVLAAKDPENTEHYFNLVNLVIDMLHDYFALTSGQRRDAEKAIKNRERTLRGLVDAFEIAQDRKSLEPANKHSAPGITGPYPVPAQALRGASTPSVQEDPDAGKARPSSLPPGIGIRPEVMDADTPPASRPPSLTAGMAEQAPEFTELPETSAHDMNVHDGLRLRELRNKQKILPPCSPPLRPSLRPSAS